MTERTKTRFSRIAVAAAVGLWGLDLAYKQIAHISYATRERCFMARSLTRPGFVVFESIAETAVIVLVGIYLGVLLARRLRRSARFVPRNPVEAFLCGSLLPICSCAAVPLIAGLKERAKFRTTMALVLAAPVLSPAVILLSFTVLGVRYGVLRIVSSFLMVIGTAHLLDFARRRTAVPLPALAARGCARPCATDEPDPCLESVRQFGRLAPFLAISALLTIALELSGARGHWMQADWGRGVTGVLLAVAIGVPLYFCQGSEVILLRPLLDHGVPVGTGIAFTLCATAVCLTSLAMLLRYLGSRLTLVLLGSVVGCSISLALLWNWLV